VPQPCLFEVEIATGNLRRCNSPGSNQIPAELIKAGGERLRSEIHKFIRSIWNKNCHSSGRNLLLCRFIKRVIWQTMRNIPLINCVHNFKKHSFGQVNSTWKWNYWGSSVWVLSL